MKGQGFLTRLGYALAGLRAAWGLEKSLRTHVAASAVVVVALVWTSAPPAWWAVMALAVGLVVAAELINTAIETLTDHLHPQRHPAIQTTKDVAAAAVLVSSVVALVVGAAFLIDQVLPRLGIGL